MKKFLSLFIIMLLGSSLFGCEKTHDEDPQVVLDKAWEKLVDKNIEYDSGTIAFKGSGSIEMEGNTGEISGDLEVTFDGSDLKDKKTAIKGKVTAKGSFEEQSGEINLEGELRQLDKKMYIFLENLKVDTADSQTNMMANLLGNLYKSQWISVPGGGLDDLEALSIDMVKEKKIADIAKKHNFFEATKDLGGQKYELRMNPEKLKAYLAEVAEVASDTEVLQEDLLAVDELFETSEYTLQVKIGDDYDIEWTKGDFKVKDPLEEQNLILSFEGTIGKKNSKGRIDLELQGVSPGKVNLDFDATHDFSPVSIEAPEGAQDFDLGDLLGIGAAGGQEGMPSFSDEESLLEGLEASQ